MIPPFSDGGICFINPLVARAILFMVVDNPAGLQMGVYRHRTQILEAALLQFFADPVGETVADRDRPDIMALVQDRLANREAPDVIAEATVSYSSGTAFHLQQKESYVHYSLHGSLIFGTSNTEISCKS